MVALTHTIQTDIQPFIARFLWLIARALGWPLFLLEGGGSLRVLNVSNTFMKT